MTIFERVFMMKSMRKRSILVLYSSSGLLSLMAAILPMQSVLADELTNISEIKGCRAIKSEAERLLCYDTVSDGGVFNEQKLKEAQVEEFGSNAKTKEAQTKSVVESGSEATTATEPYTKPETKPEAKAEPARGLNDPIDRIAVTVTRTQKDANGRLYFETTDGQVWKQQESSSWTEKAPFEAEIKAGKLGSFYLLAQGGKSIRVKRVR